MPEPDPAPKTSACAVTSPRSSDRALLLETIAEAGALARNFFSAGAKSWRKDKGEPITEADLAVDRLIHERIRTAHPEDGWLSEESRDNPERLNRRRVWIVDPIDGTLAFIKGRAHFAVSMALVDNHIPVLAAVYNPLTEELFAAEAGRGATLNGAAIAVSRRETLEGCRMLGPRDLFTHAAWPQPWPSMEIENRNSIAYRIALVAAGSFDAMLTLAPKREWDVVAGDLIAREAGGCVTGHDGTPLRYNAPIPHIRSIVCAGRALHAQILERVGRLSLP